MRSIASALLVLSRFSVCYTVCAIVNASITIFYLSLVHSFCMHVNGYFLCCYRHIYIWKHICKRWPKSSLEITRVQMSWWKWCVTAIQVSSSPTSNALTTSSLLSPHLRPIQCIPLSISLYVQTIWRNGHLTTSVKAEIMRSVWSGCHSVCLSAGLLQK